MRKLCYIIIGILMIGCSKDEVISDKQYPVVITKLIDIDENGALISGQLVTRGEEKIQELGFFFGNDANNIKYYIKIDEISENFNHLLNHDIKEGEEIYVRSAVKTKSYNTLGNIIQFTSQGFISDPPAIKSIYPRNVAEGYIVTIEGTNFPHFPEHLQVSIDKVDECEIISNNSNEIKFLCPGLEEGEKAIKIKCYSSEIGNETISFVSPEVYKFSPSNAYDATQITLYGKYFGEHPKVFFGAQKGRSILESDSLLIVESPMTKISGEVELKVLNSTGTFNCTDPFNVNIHTVDNISPKNAKVGDLITITGTGLLQNGRSSFVYINSQNIKIENCNNNQLSFKIPNLDDFVASSITVSNGLKDVTTEDLNLIKSWTLLDDSPASPMDRAVGIAVGGKAYFGIGATSRSYYRNPTLEWWSYTPSNNEWTRLANFEGSPRCKCISFSIDNKIYVGLGWPKSGNINTMPADLWSYDISSDTWTNMGDIPDTYLNPNYSSALAYNGKGYIHESESFFEYNPELNEWKELTALNYRKTSYYTSSPECFTIKNRLFWIFSYRFFYGSTRFYTLYEYLPEEDSWITHCNFTDDDWKSDVAYYTLFSTEDKAYLCGGRPWGTEGNYKDCIYEIDPIKLTFVRKENMPEVACGHTSVAISGKGYVGFGTSDGTISSSRFWQFDP